MSDYTLDWASANIDGANTLSSGEGPLGVSIQTPGNGSHDNESWHIGKVGGLSNQLIAKCVEEPTKVSAQFDTPVENVVFELLDVDSDNCNWDERVTIIARDADGNIVPVVFSNTESHHHVNGNVLNTTGDSGQNNVTVTIAGPIVSLEIILDNGASASTTGTVGVGDLHFDAVATPLDGYVDGTDGDDVIDVDYAGDPDGDCIDANDQILPGEGTNDDVVLAGKGNDLVMAKDGNDEIYGGEGNDTLCGQDGDDTIYGGTGNDILEGMNDNDLLFGQAGNDTVMGDAGDDILSGGAGDDRITGGTGDDVAYGGKGTDKIDGGAGDDTVWGGAGADSINGNAGNDTLLGGGVSHTGTIDFDDLSKGEMVNGQYLAKGVHIYSADPHNPVMVFDTDSISGGDGDLSNGDGKVLILSEDRDGTDPDDNAAGGTFVFEFDGPAYVGSLDFVDIEGGAWIKMYDANDNLIRQIDTAKTANNGTLSQTINQAGVCRMEVILADSGAIDNLNYTLDGNAGDLGDVIKGDGGDDYIDGMAGDDTLFGGTGNDTVLGSDGDDQLYGGDGDDTLSGGAGNDKIEGADGDDTLYGNAGDDDLSGGSGNDVIYGDDPDGSTAPVRESFEWDLAPDPNSGGAIDNDDPLTGFTQNTGNVNVTFSTVSSNGAGVESVFANNDQNVANVVTDGGAADDNSSLSSTTNGNGNSVKYALDYSAPVQNVSFQINDIDGDGVVKVTAFDMDGNPIEVNLSGGSKLTLLNTDAVPGADTGDSNGGYEDDTSGNYTLTVSIPGPVSRIVIDHSQNGPNNSGINITDVYFDALADADATGGDDVIDGGDGNDTIFGNAGNDTITTGAGNDVVDAGDDADTIFGSAGDIIDGGAGGFDRGTDNDTLDLTGQGDFYLTGPDGTGDPVADSNGNGLDGKVVFVDADGNPTGETISFTEIENIVGSEVNRGPDAADDSFTVNEDDAAAPVGNVLADNGNGTDSDPDGDPLTIGAVNGDAGNVGTPVAGDNGGLITIAADGTISFDPNGEFDALGEGEETTTTITYTVDDGNGGTDTASVTFTVTGTNDGPVATDNTYGVALTEGAGDIDGNVITQDTGDGVDSDPENDPLNVSEVNGIAGNVGIAVAGDAGGLFTINDDGTVDFDANGDFDDLGLGATRSTSVQYTLSDGKGGTDTATATFVVTGINDGIVEGTAAGDLIDVAYDGDPNGDFVDNNDAILGTDAPNDDRIYAYGGDDTVLAGLGDDLVFGGTGNDTLYGEDGNDTLNGDQGDDVVYGGAGNDTLNGNQGNDILNGGAGDDFINGGIGNDTIFGGTGNDVLNGQDGADSISGGAGDDMINGGAGNDTLLGNAGNDKIEGSEGDDLIRGGDGDDDLWGGLDNDTIFGGDGNDTVDGADGDDVLDGALGDDSINGGAGADSIQGGAGDDNIDGGADNDTIIAGIGNDIVAGGDGDDVIDAGNHINPAFDNPYPGLGAPDAFPNNDLDTVYGGAGNDIISTGDDADFIDGGTGDDTIDAGIDNDSVIGGDGNDTIIGGEGVDIIEGNDGDDLIYGGLSDDTLDIVDELPDGTLVDLLPGNNTDTIYGGDGNDTIYGRDDDDTLFGGQGDDELYGGVDDDVVEGNEGNDLVFGGQGNDLVFGGEGIDLVSGGIGNDIVFGGADTDVVLGDAGDDKLSGGDGADLLDGGDGNDEINGDAGNDLLLGEAGDDTISGGDGDDFIGGGAGNDTITGDAGDDVIIGEDGDDEIYGGTGNDVIDGAAGADVMFGGDDRDTFIEVGPGDVIDGGEGGDDFDTLIISGPALIDYDPADPEAGTITFLDINTQLPIGTATFQNIENIEFVDVEPNPIEPDNQSDLDDDPDTIVVPAPPPPASGGTGGSGSPDGYVDGTAGDDVIELGYTDADGDAIDAGDAILTGEGPDDDIVRAGAGDDSVSAGAGNDHVFGGTGNDTIAGNDGDDVLRGEAGDDSIDGGAGNDEISGGDGNDILAGGAGNDKIEGRDGDDTIRGDEGQDFLVGGEGDDVIFGGADGDIIVGGVGNDILSGGAGDGAADLLAGQDDRDTFKDLGVGDKVFGGDGGDDFDTLDLRGSTVPGGSLAVTITGPDSDGNGSDGFVTYFDAAGNTTGTLNFENIESIVPCFTPGTTIATPKGERLVEELKVGDRIITRDNGIQEIAWVGHKQMSGTELVQKPHMRPVLIKAGSLGHDLPERDMMVSPNHRVLVASEMTQLYFEEREVLAAAKHMTGAVGIHSVEVMQTTYIHFMFERHEVVLSNGAWTESFQPGDLSLNGIGNSQRNEIFELFPELATPKGLENYQAARKLLKKHESRLLVR